VGRIKQLNKNNQGRKPQAKKGKSVNEYINALIDKELSDFKDE
jgi:hypothetical protein